MNFLNVIQWIAHLTVMTIGFQQNFLILINYIVFIGNLNILGNYQNEVWDLVFP